MAGWSSSSQEEGGREGLPPWVGWETASGVHGTGGSLDTHSWLYVEKELFGRPGSFVVSGFWLAFLPRCFWKFCVNRADSIFPVRERTQVRWASSTGWGQVGRGHPAHSRPVLVRERPSLALGPSSSLLRYPGSRRLVDWPPGRQRAASSSAPPVGRPVWRCVHTRMGMHTLFPSRGPAVLYLETSPLSRNRTYHQSARSSSG